ncbi:hypothetical protein SAMN02745116_00145 [Pilibacter termitis]|uniref:Uncharacterized protein n=1 Tax=Pilibacter termitis TaxID=263852 RepID=A0A1T4K815_9ENTE|nr:hypothetical protein [Pilibacter termitis]SJZ38551.1 hypothetical protein SAMN02745116_00145 [Pilibacter termitis]
MKREEMIARTHQLAKNQETIEEIFVRNKEEHRAEVARIKRVMYENFAELLENWLDYESEAEK